MSPQPGPGTVAGRGLWSGFTFVWRNKRKVAFLLLCTLGTPSHVRCVYGLNVPTQGLLKVHSARAVGNKGHRSPRPPGAHLLAAERDTQQATGENKTCQTEQSALERNKAGTGVGSSGGVKRAFIVDGVASLSRCRFRENLEEMRGLVTWMSVGRNAQREEIVGTKVLRQDHGWYASGTRKGQCGQKG